MYQQWLTQLSNPSFKLSLWHPLLSFKRYSRFFHRYFHLTELLYQWCAGLNTRFAITDVAPQRRFEGQLLASKLTKSLQQSSPNVLIWDRWTDFTVNMYIISERILEMQGSRKTTWIIGLTGWDTCFAEDQLIGPNGALPDTACLMVCTAIVHVFESGLNTNIEEHDRKHSPLTIFFISRSCFWHLLLSSLSVMSLVLCCA